MKEYSVLIGRDLIDLCATMDKSFADGWIAIGGISVTFLTNENAIMYAQAMGR